MPAYTFVQEIRWLWQQACANVIGGAMLWDGTWGLGGYNDAAKFGMDLMQMTC